MTRTIQPPERLLRLLVLASADVVHTRRWVTFFRARGHEVLLATLEPSPERDLDEIILPSVVRRPMLLRYGMAVPALARLVRSFKPDLVSAHYVPGYGFLAALAPQARPLAVSCWGSDLLVNAGRSPLHRLRAALVLRAASLLTCDARVLADKLAGMGVAKQKIICSPLGIEKEIFHPADTAPDPPAARRGEPGRPVAIISTRRLEPVYCVETLLRAALLLREEGWNLHLSVAGDGSQRPALEHFSGYYSPDGHLAEFIGWLPPERMAECLRASDIYVSCSRSDGASVSLLEALACGAFPVVSDIPGNREWIQDGVNGLLFPAGDFGRLSECLARAMANYELRRKAREKNFRLIEERALWERNMQVVEDKFIALVEQAKAINQPRGRQNGQKPVERS